MSEEGSGPTKEVSAYVLDPYSTDQNLVRIETLSSDVRGCRLALWREVKALEPELIRLREISRYFGEMELLKTLLDAAIAIPPKGDDGK
jgi:hypothetical protein